MLLQPLKRLILHEEGWEVHASGQQLKAQICGSSTSSRFVCVVRFYLPNHWRKYSYVLFPDSFDDKNEFRRFRAKLKVNKPSKS